MANTAELERVRAAAMKAGFHNLVRLTTRLLWYN